MKVWIVYRVITIKYSDRGDWFSFENAQLKRRYGEETETVKRDKDSVKNHQYLRYYLLMR